MVGDESILPCLVVSLLGLCLREITCRGNPMAGCCTVLALGVYQGNCVVVLLTVVADSQSTRVHILDNSIPISISNTEVEYSFLTKQTKTTGAKKNWNLLYIIGLKKKKCTAPVTKSLTSWSGKENKMEGELHPGSAQESDTSSSSQGMIKCQHPLTPQPSPRQTSYSSPPGRCPASRGFPPRHT